MKANVTIKSLSDGFIKAVRRKTPEILTGTGIAGMLMTTIIAVRATPEAIRRIENEKKRLKQNKLTVSQTIKAAWKCYIPAGVTGIVSATCLVGASAVNNRRNAALATAASIAERSLREYREKVIDTIGERKESAILDAVDQERINRNPPPKNAEVTVPNAYGGQTLCYDSMFGRYFYSDVETLRRAENKLNRQMSTMSEPYISLNEFYMEIGLSAVDIGDELGWNVNEGMIELHFSSLLVDGRIPCLVVSHLVPPKYDYNR